MSHYQANVPEWYISGKNPWYISGKFLQVGQGNNAFSWPKKADRNPLMITPLKVGRLDELKISDQIAFQDFDGETWLECHGLQTGILCLEYDIPIYVFDNHNHVFYAWAEALKMGWFHRGASLIHMDEHFDDSVAPDTMVDVENLDDVYRYTNEVLQIATYIKPALESGIFKDCLNYVESPQFEVRSAEQSEFVINLDIDVFHPDMSHISWQQKIDVLKYYLPRTKLLTMATSPYFIDQRQAIELIRKVISELYPM